VFSGPCGFVIFFVMSIVMVHDNKHKSVSTCCLAD